MVDEDAGELVADGLVDQHRGHRGVDAARQSANDPALADLRADARDRFLAETRACVQSPWQPATLITKLREQLGASRRVRHLGVELHAVDAALLVGNGRERRAL